MKNIIIAPVGKNLNHLFIGLREFPTEKIILISPPDKLKIAEKVVKDLKKFNIPIEIKKINGNIIEEMFKVFAEIKNKEKNKNIIVNIATGDEISTCAALSAAFVNGIKAFTVINKKVMLMPILKFSYYKILTDKKLDILKTLYDKDSISIKEISKQVKMSLPLTYYHINGTFKEDGLEGLGLVEFLNKSQIKLSTLGKLLIKGYL